MKRVFLAFQLLTLTVVLWCVTSNIKVCILSTVHILDFNKLLNWLFNGNSPQKWLWVVVVGERGEWLDSGGTHERGQKES